MKITFFMRSHELGVSMEKHFTPLIAEIAKTEEVEVFFLPRKEFTPMAVMKNIWFVYKHRNKKGINHMTGDCHYVMLALIGCKSVLTIHDLVFYYYLSYSRILKWILYQLYIYWPVKTAKRVIAITEKTKQEIEDVIPFKRHIDVVKHIAVDEFCFTPKVMDKNHVIVLHNGTGVNKNLETTMKAVADLGYELIVIRKMTEEQQKMAEGLHLKYTNIYNLTDDEIVKTYQKADIVCFPSLYEGFGAITLEGQATGRPVITTNREPMRTVAGGAACLINNPQDYKELAAAIKKIVDDDAYRNGLVESGFQNAAKYTLKNCAKEHLELYHAMI